MNSSQHVASFEDPYIEGPITSNPLVMHGAPILKGTTVTVVNVITAIRDNPSRTEVAKNLGITKDQVKACITYCREHWPKFFLVAVAGMSQLTTATAS